MPLKFVTLSVDLIEHAESFAASLRNSGFSVKAEPEDGSFPQVPTLAGSRGIARHYVEITGTIRKQFVDQWVSYCKCRQRETYFSVVLPAGAATIKPELLRHLRDAGVGLYHSDDAGLVEIVVPRDLNLDLALPPLAGNRRSVRMALQPIYAKFGRGDWHDGFKDACQLLESHARRYLLARVQAGHATFVKAGVPKTYSAAQLRRLTIGQLAIAFSELVLPDAKDEAIRRALVAINPDRIGAVHKTDDRRVRNRLRKNVGTHMWILVNGLKVLL